MPLLMVSDEELAALHHTLTIAIETRSDLGEGQSGHALYTTWQQTASALHGVELSEGEPMPVLGVAARCETEEDVRELADHLRDIGCTPTVEERPDGWQLHSALPRRGERS